MTALNPWKAGYILLEGGAEFGGRMAEADLRALELAGGFEAPVCILPTAAAPDHNDERAGSNGVRWFTHLGAKRVARVPVIDRASANRESHAEAIRQSRFIYLLGGFPRYLEETLRASLSWRAMLEAFRAGAVIGGSSAGAMVLAEYYYDPEGNSLREGLGLLPRICLIPHHNTFGKRWAARLASLLPDGLWIGIDEQTGIIGESTARWTVHGKGQATLYQQGKARAYHSGETFSL
ncbi:MAG: Type 1 glutamine amidotransferase-like domain-containing protein [Anaerolineales bacterium]|jgi:cyanophycinase